MPHVDSGDFVIVINAEKVVLTGKQGRPKIYYRHSGRPGGSKAETARVLRARKPRSSWSRRRCRACCRRATLGRQQYRKLKVYAGADHPHQAQKPQALPLAALRGRTRLVS